MSPTDTKRVNARFEKIYAHLDKIKETLNKSSIPTKLVKKKRVKKKT